MTTTAATPATPQAAEPGATALLAAWSAGLTFDDLPEEVVAGARQRLLDYLASALAGSTRDHAAPIVEVARQNGSVGPGCPCTVIGTDERASAEWASLLNSTFGSSGPNLDDYWNESYGHPGVGSWPTALSATELHDGTGADLLLAAVVGYEFSTRIGSAVGIEAFHRGWHPRGGLNGLSAAAAFLKASGHTDPGHYRRALGHAANMAGGTVHGSYYFTSWYLLSGAASLNGTIAAQLAVAGLTSNERMLDLEERGNYLTMVSTEPLAHHLTAGLGATYRMLEVPIKVFPATGSLHSTIEAAVTIATQREIRLEDIASVRIGTFQLAADELNRPFPDNIVHGSMSTPYLACLALLRGDVDLALLAAGLDDPEVRTLQERTTVTIDPVIDAAAPEVLGARVVVELHDGTILSEEVGRHRGSPSRPLTWDATVEKFTRMTHQCVSAERRQAIVAAVAGIVEATSISPLLSLLGRE